MTVELNRIYPGDCIEVMKTWPDNFVDTIITDPPYGIGFMGKDWDRFNPEVVARYTEGYRTKEGRHDSSKMGTKRIDSAATRAGLYDQSVSGNRQFQSWCCAWATEALRIAKPGAIMLVSGGTRTFHRMTAGLEDAGWQIRDCLMWLYGSGFPKSLDISKAIDKSAGHWRGRCGAVTIEEQPAKGTEYERTEKGEPVTATATAWRGYGTALKPAWEPIIVAMKPLDGTFAENAETWGVAGINVDGGRVGTCAESFIDHREDKIQRNAYGKYGAHSVYDGSKGRWPANLILDEEAAVMLDGVSGATKSTPTASHTNEGCIYHASKTLNGSEYRDSGGASRFFYVAKSSRAERNEGCEELQSKPKSAWGSIQEFSSNPPSGNHHPTVKPLSLMKYLCMLTKTPTGGIVLDPFAGSGTTLWAAEFHNRPWIGIEMNPEYVAIANARIARERSQMKMAI